MSLLHVSSRPSRRKKPSVEKNKKVRLVNRKNELRSSRPIETVPKIRWRRCIINII
jgi:hypothetical protein